MGVEVDTFVCRQLSVWMASQELKIFLSSINWRYLDYADAIYEGEFTSQAELGAAERTDLQALGIPKGAAGLIIAVLHAQVTPLVPCSTTSLQTYALHCCQPLEPL